MTDVLTTIFIFQKINEKTAHLTRLVKAHRGRLSDDSVNRDGVEDRASENLPRPTAFQTLVLFSSLFLTS